MGRLSELPWVGSCHISEFALTSWIADSVNSDIYHLPLPKMWSEDILSNCSSMWEGSVHHLPEHLRLCLALTWCSVTTWGTKLAMTLTRFSGLHPGELTMERGWKACHFCPPSVLKGQTTSICKSWDANSGTLVPRVLLRAVDLCGFLLTSQKSHLMTVGGRGGEGCIRLRRLSNCFRS